MQRDQEGTGAPDAQGSGEQEPGEQGLTDKALGGMAWITSSSGVQSALRVLVVALLARLLVPADFGVMSAALIVIGLADMSGMLGVGSALVQLPAIDERHVHTGFNFSVLFGLAVAAGIWALSPAFADLFHMPRLAPVLDVLAWVFPLKAVSKVSRSFIQRALQYKKLAAVDVISYVTYGVVGIALALMNFGVWALVWANLVQAAVSSVVLFVMQPHSVRLSFDWEPARELLFFGSGFTVAGVFSYAAQRGDNFVVGRWMGAGALGIYGRAYGLMNATNSLLGHVINKVFFPAFSKAQSEPERLARAYRRGIALTTMLLLPISIASIILAPELVATLLGDQWDGVVLPFQILAVGMTWRIVYKVGGTLATGTGAVYNHAWRKAVQTVLVVGGAWLAQRAGGGVAGVAASTLVALVVFGGLTVHLALKITALPARELGRVCLPALPLGALVGAGTWGVATVLRHWGAPSWATLIVTFVVVGGTTICVVVLLAGRFLGKDGRWFLQKSSALLPAERWSFLRPLQQGLRRAGGRA